jgi:hypothetical protein
VKVTDRTTIESSNRRFEEKYVVNCDTHTPYRQVLTWLEVSLGLSKRQYILTVVPTRIGPSISFMATGVDMIEVKDAGSSAAGKLLAASDVD